MPCFCCKAAEREGNQGGLSLGDARGDALHPSPCPRFPQVQAPRACLGVALQATVSMGALLGRGVRSTQEKRPETFPRGLGVPGPAATLFLPSSPGLGPPVGHAIHHPSREITAQKRWHVLPQHMAVTRSSRSPCPSPAWPRRPPKIALMYVRHPLEQTDPIM